MRTTQLTLAIGITLLLTSCQTAPTANRDAKTIPDTAQLAGYWVQPNPINDREMQGFMLNKDGSAQSVNMATLKYHKWWVEAGRLVLVEESIGNRTSSIDTIRYEVAKVTDKELELKDGGRTEKYTRQ